MTNGHVLHQLSAWAGQDLLPKDQDLVEAHLAVCVGCRAEAERLREARAWLQEAMDPPFEATDHAALQAAILARVPQEPAPRRIARLRLRALGLTAALLLLALWPGLRRGLSPAPASPKVASHPEASVFPSLPPRLEAVQRKLRALPKPPEARSRVAPKLAPIQVARLEFQTSDPSIRIIWLANDAATSAPNPSLLEAP